MSKIAIFGSKGYLGSQLVFYFMEHGVGIDGFDIPECDICNSGFWKTFDATQYDAIVFFAGLTGTEQGFTEAAKYVAINELGLLNLLTVLAPLGSRAPRVVFPSTRLVYKGENCLLKEDAPKETKTVYAVNKLACEGYLSAYANRFGLPYSVIRICVPYGSLISSGYSYGTVGFFMKQLLEKKEISLYGGGAVRRTFTHVADICRVVKFLIDTRRSGIYNIGGDDLSLAEVATYIVQQRGGTIKNLPWPDSALSIESGSTVFDSSKLDALSCREYIHLKDCSF